MDIWLIILIIFFSSALLTFILWKVKFLTTKTKPYEIQGPSAMGEYEHKAYFKLNNILEFEIPKWMAKQPYSFAVSFLIVCIGIAVIIIAINTLI